jgi:hypothetical protein
MELAAARAEEALARTHVSHALGFVELLETQADPSRAVSLYLDRMGEPEARSRSVYQRALAELAESLLPRLLAYAGDDEAEEPA